jgi:hypothetical protein
MGLDSPTEYVLQMKRIEEEDENDDEEEGVSWSFLARTVTGKEPQI